jgi:hypothetical protein
MTKTWDGGKGFNPIARYNNDAFSGIFYGNCFEINNLYINRDDELMGLFAIAKEATFINIKLNNVDITGKGSGGLVAVAENNTKITDSFVKGTVRGVNYSGGLVGYLNNSVIENSYTSGSVYQSKIDGITSIYVGGLVGYNISGTISKSYSTANVFGSDNYLLGGLVGGNYGLIENCYATGKIEAPLENSSGGLVGENAVNGVINNSYASGAINSAANVGGLVGKNLGKINNSFATGKVAGLYYMGGLVGDNKDLSVITNSYWAANTSGIKNCVGKGSALGCTSTGNAWFWTNTNKPLNDWDFNTIWEYEKYPSYPTLKSKDQICGQCVNQDDGTGSTNPDTPSNPWDPGTKITINTNIITTGIATTNIYGPAVGTGDSSWYDQFKGKIIMRPESHGETYYISPIDSKIYYLSSAATAYTVMGQLGVGITPVDLDKFKPAYIPNNDLDTDGDGLSDKFELSLDFNPNSEDTDGDGWDDKLELESNNSVTGPGPAKYDFTFAANHAGNIYLDVVGGHGEAWYINPADNLRYYLGTPEDAFAVMKNSAIGVSELDFNRLIGQ